MNIKGISRFNLDMLLVLQVKMRIYNFWTSRFDLDVGLRYVGFFNPQFVDFVAARALY